MEKEKSIEPNMNKKRLLQALASCVLLLFIGMIYAWSTFIPPLENEFAWSRSELTLAFTICMCMFCIGGLVAGAVSKKRSTFFLLRICAVLVLLGFGLASFVKSLIGIYVCYGIMVGFAVGIAYNTVISSTSKWFPGNTGFISGIMLMCFGMGGMVLGTVCSTLMETIGWRHTFLGIAIVYFVIVIICSFVIAAPPDDFGLAKKEKQQEISYTKDYETKEMLRTPSFWIMFIWAVALTASGLALFGHASPITMDLGASVSKSALYAGIISLCNGLGRLIVGVIFDKIGRGITMCIVSLGLSVSGILLIFAQTNSDLTLLLIGFVVAGLSYGGIMPCNSTVISQFYGSRHYAMNFSMINMNILIASPVGPMIAATLYGSSGNYASTFIVITVLGACAFILNILLRFIQKEK